jgi:hypothetical protein
VLETIVEHHHVRAEFHEQGSAVAIRVLHVQGSGQSAVAPALSSARPRARDSPARTFGTRPRSRNRSAIQRTIGVFPDPPVLRLPTLTTGTARRPIGNMPWS